MDGEEAAEVRAALRLLAGLLVPCLALLGLLSGLLLLRQGRLRRRRRPPPRSPGGARAPPPCARAQRRVPPACRASASSSDREKRPPRVPPNSPAGSWAGAGTPDGALGRQHTSTRRKIPGCRPVFPARLHPAPFEYSSSIQHGDPRWNQLNSANFTASQGPGLDSDFGASAGVSLRILSSDSDESPTAPLVQPQQSGRFEWDYYDPSYKKSMPPPSHLPGLCSKQYWL